MGVYIKHPHPLRLGKYACHMIILYKTILIVRVLCFTGGLLAGAFPCFLSVEKPSAEYWDRVVVV